MLSVIFLTCGLLGSVVAQDECTPQLGLFGMNIYSRMQEKIKTYVEDTDIGKKIHVPKVQWFDQKLDHLTPSNTETWKQKYAEKNYGAGHEDGNIIFLDIGGEGNIYSGSVTVGSTADIASKFKARIFILEHRFYGDSRPKADFSLESLKYLSSEQALADAAYFIKQMNKKYNLTNPKWVAIGGSYAGSLAAWLRYKYPDLVHAALSSSGPLHAKADFPEYLETVSQSLEKLNPGCSDAISNASQVMIRDIYNQTGRENYTQLFNLCESIGDNEQDFLSLFDGLVESITSGVQYYHANAALDFKKSCKIMTEELPSYRSPIERYGDWSKYYCNNKCLQHKKSELVKRLRRAEFIDRQHADRQWFYQTCSEFGWYATTREGSAFGNKLSVEFFTDICKDVFGPRFDVEFINNATEETNSKYKGYSIPASRVIFTHGSLDPWSPLGIIKDPPEGSYAILIEGEGHCSDLGFFPDIDGSEVKKAKKKIMEILESWLR